MTTERARQGLLLSASGADSSMTAGIGGAGETIGHKHGERGIHNRGLIAAMGDDRSESELFQRVRARLRAQVGEDIFNSWFARLELEEIVEDRVHLSVPTRFLSSWIQSNYAEKILDVFKTEIPHVTRLHLTVRVNGQTRPRLEKQAEVPTEPEVDPAPQARPSSSREVTPPKGDALSGSALDAKMTFENFVPGASNEIALGIAKQVAHAALNGTVSFNPVYIHSTVGLGKSHLLNAIAWAAGAAEPGRNIVYLTADHFMYHFITAVQRQSAIALKDWLRRVDLLLIDDMQFLQGKSATEFGHTLGTLLTGAKQVVVAGDAPPRDLDMLDERVRSRLSGGLVVPITGFDLDLRKSIVVRRAEQVQARFGVHFPPAVIEYISRIVVSHGRDLDGAVNRLVAANQLTNEPITVALAERTLADLVRARETRRVRIEDILRIVSRHYKVPRNELLSSRRSRDVVRPRQIAMYLAKSLTSRSLPEIGRRFGGRDHTTVLHSVRKVEQMMKDDADLTQEIELLKRMLEE
jgi:chromosomal replication initiator protein